MEHCPECGASTIREQVGPGLALRRCEACGWMVKLPAQVEVSMEALWESRPGERIKALTEAGQAERQRQVELARKRRRIGCMTDVRGTQWYRDVIRRLFAAAYESRYWVWIEVDEVLKCR